MLGARSLFDPSHRVFLASLAGLTCAGGAPARAPINMQQLVRILDGQTIPETPRASDEFTSDFELDDRRFVPTGDNPHFPLRPGHQVMLAGDDEGSHIELTITVLRETQSIVALHEGNRIRVRARVVEERETIDGELYEISRNYYAIDAKSGDVFYFGEDVCFFENGECVRTDGSWLAGVNDATPGIIMPGTFILGARYFQEQAPGVALDRAEHMASGLTIDTPAGRLEECVAIYEDSALDPAAQSEKFYCPEIGLVKDGVLELVSYTPIPED